MKNDIVNKNEQNSLKCNSASIMFKRKRKRCNIKFGGKVIAFFIIAGISGVLFSTLMMELKYEELLYKANTLEKDKKDIINDYSKMLKIILPSIVTVSADKDKLIEGTYSEKNSTGVILDRSGTILTNYSNIKNVNQIYVKLPSKGTKPVKARFITGDEGMDVAIIKIDYDGDIVPIKISEDNTEEGEGIVILSNLIGNGYIVPGIITSTSQSIISEENKNKYRLTEVNALINRENNGGIICNSKGELIGIASESISKKKSSKGSYYAINISEIDEIANSTNVFKRVLGLTGGGIIPENNNGVNGFYVENLIKGGNAYNSGIKPTDIIFNIDGININNLQDISKVLEHKKSGDSLRCQVKRGRKIEEINIYLK